MKLVAITDLHQSSAALGRILAAAGPCDVVLLGGDITNFGTPDDARQIVARAETTAAQVLAVAGNCDSAAIEARLVELGVSLFRRGVILSGVGVHGLSAMPPWLGHMYHFTEAELADALETGRTQVDGARHHIVLSHPPPRGESVDRTAGGENVGSTALREFIERCQPDLVLCGHIHEGRGTERIGRTVVANCGLAAAGCYAAVDVNEGVHVELRSC